MRLITIILFISLISGCAATSNKNQNISKVISTEIAAPVFARLDSIDNRYSFTRFSTEKPLNDKEAWVDLQTGRPLWDIKTQRCGKGLVKDRHKEVKDCSEVIDDKLFLESDFDTGDAAARVFGSIFTMGLTLTGLSYDVVFNEDRYSEAYLSASKKIQPDELNKLSETLKKINSTYRETIDFYNNSFDLVKTKYNIEDKSGFYKNEIDFSSIINFHKNSISEIPHVYAKTITELNSNLEREYQKLVKEWKDQTNTIRVKCPATVQNLSNYNFNLTCPDQITLINMEFIADIKVSINSKDFFEVYPENIKINDDLIALDLSRKYISLTNKTEKFITIDSISFYHNGKVAKNQKLDIELSPKSSTLPENRLRIRSFPIDQNSISFPEMTKQKAVQTKIEYGFAIKYRVIDTKTEKTIFSVKKYPLYNLLS